ncbi:unnamed protein product [Polarella glacialis]|uniref:Uncharacterized protein n=1 Tax=Polarella glacialis TaxID=89957 RepID=A0A813FPV2_POLGL|nr:unnamed protein product [Polarella glacialis]
MVDIAAKKLLSLFFDSVWFVKPSKAKSLEPVVQAWCKTKKKTVDSKEWERMLAEVNKYLKDTYPSAFDGDRSPHVFRYKDGQVEITKKWRKVIEQSYEKKLANYFLREREIHFTQGLDVDLDESLSRVSVPTLASPRTPPTLSLPTATTSTPVRASSALPTFSPPKAAPLSTPAATALSTPVSASSRLSLLPPVKVPLVKAPSAPEVLYIGSKDQDEVLSPEQIDMLGVSDLGISGRPAGGSCEGGPQATATAPSSTMPLPPPAKASYVPRPPVKASSMTSFSAAGTAPSSSFSGALPMPPSSTSAAVSRDKEVLDWWKQQVDVLKQLVVHFLDKSRTMEAERDRERAEKNSLEEQLVRMLGIVAPEPAPEPSVFVNLTPAPLAHLGSQDVSYRSRSSTPPSRQAPNGQQQQDPSSTLDWGSVNFDLKISEILQQGPGRCSDAQRRCMEQLEFETEQELKDLLDKRYRVTCPRLNQRIQCLKGPSFPIEFSRYF